MPVYAYFYSMKPQVTAPAWTRPSRRKKPPSAIRFQFGPPLIEGPRLRRPAGLAQTRLSRCPPQQARRPRPTGPRSDPARPEQIRNQVGANQRIFLEHPAGQYRHILPPKANPGGYNIPARVGAGDADGLGIVIEGVHQHIAKLGGGNGENCRPVPMSEQDCGFAPRAVGPPVGTNGTPVVGCRPVPELNPGSSTTTACPFRARHQLQAIQQQRGTDHHRLKVQLPRLCPMSMAECLHETLPGPCKNRCRQSV